jgi:hypothetical protein
VNEPILHEMRESDLSALFKIQDDPEGARGGGEAGRRSKKWCSGWTDRLIVEF